MFISQLIYIFRVINFLMGKSAMFLYLLQSNFSITFHLEEFGWHQLHFLQ